MKVIRLEQEDLRLTKSEQRKISILKLVADGKYVEGVGIKDHDFYVLTEDKEDEAWLSFILPKSNWFMRRVYARKG